MGIQSICKVKASVTPVKPDGTNEAAIVVPYYFRGSGVYKSSTTIATAASIEHIPSDKWQGDMPLTPVADLVRAGIVDRLNVIVQDQTTKKKRNYSLQRFAGSWGTVIFKSLIQKEVADCKRPPYACELLYSRNGQNVLTVATSILTFCSCKSNALNKVSIKKSVNN